MHFRKFCDIFVFRCRSVQIEPTKSYTSFLEERNIMNRIRLHRFLLILSFSFSILGCVNAKSSGVLSTGKDTYSVVVTASQAFKGPTEMSDLMKMAYEEANFFCQQQGKVMQPLSTFQRPRDFSNPDYFELRFRALYPNDPEYRRPTLESVPGTRIEIQPK
jgi:hypothetical protein